MDTSKIKLKVIQLNTEHEECRCCGRGREAFCDRCGNLNKEGYAFLIEVRDNSTINRQRTTGYSVAILAASVKDFQPTIYFIRATDLKEFLSNDYNNPEPIRFLSKRPSWNNAQPGSTERTRQVTELAHRRY